MTNAPGYRETKVDVRHILKLAALRQRIHVRHYEALERDFDRAESELAKATARAEKAEADFFALNNDALAIENARILAVEERDVLANALAQNYGCPDQALEESFVVADDQIPEWCHLRFDEGGEPLGCDVRDEKSCWLTWAAQEAAKQREASHDG